MIPTRKRLATSRAARSTAEGELRRFPVTLNPAWRRIVSTVVPITLAKPSAKLRRGFSQFITICSSDLWTLHFLVVSYFSFLGLHFADIRDYPPRSTSPFVP